MPRWREWRRLKRKVNQAGFDGGLDLTRERGDDQVVIEPRRDETYLVLRQFADEILTRPS